MALFEVCWMYPTRAVRVMSVTKSSCCEPTGDTVQVKLGLPSACAARPAIKVAPNKPSAATRYMSLRFIIRFLPSDPLDPFERLQHGHLRRESRVTLGPHRASLAAPHSRPRPAAAPAPNR